MSGRYDRRIRKRTGTTACACIQATLGRFVRRTMLWSIHGSMVHLSRLDLTWHLASSLLFLAWAFGRAAIAMRNLMWDRPFLSDIIFASSPFHRKKQHVLPYAFICGNNHERSRHRKVRSEQESQCRVHPLRNGEGDVRSSVSIRSRCTQESTFFLSSPVAVAGVEK